MSDKIKKLQRKPKENKRKKRKTKPSLILEENRKRKGRGKSKGMGKEEEMQGGNERRKGKGWKGSIIGLNLLFEHMDIAKVSLGPPKISLSPLACTQLCIPLQMWTSGTI